MIEAIRIPGAAAVCAALVAAALLPTGLRAQDEHRQALPEPAPAIVLAEPAVPHAVGGKLYWSDHRLAALCQTVGGRFAKLAGSAVYVCTPQRSERGSDEAGGTVARR